MGLHGDDVERRLRRLEAFAAVMDSAIPIPGTPYRAGVESLIGLIPGVGDLVGAGLSSYLFAEAAALKARKRTMARMALNIAVDTVVGAVPVLGDLFDIGFRANARNARLIIADVARRRARAAPAASGERRS